MSDKPRASHANTVLPKLECVDGEVVEEVLIMGASRIGVHDGRGKREVARGRARRAVVYPLQKVCK